MIRSSRSLVGRLRPNLLGTSSGALSVGSRSVSHHASSPAALLACRQSVFTRTTATTSQVQIRLRAVIGRELSTSEGGGGGGEEGKKKKAPDDYGAEDDDTKEIVMTPGEKVVAVSRMLMWVGIGVFAICCGYYIVMELLPTKMGPNSVFDSSFEVVRKDPDVLRRYGDSVKAYGRDHGGHREGRRNFVEHTKYKNKEDGSNRTRVRYNLEGRFGTAFVFAEVSDKMPSGEFVYVLVQDKANGQIQAIIDNRAALTAQRLAAGSQEAQSAMAQLLAGGKK